MKRFSSTDMGALILAAVLFVGGLIWLLWPHEMVVVHATDNGTGWLGSYIELEISAKRLPSFVQPGWMAGAMLNGQQPDFLAADYIKDAVLVETPQPGPANIGKSGGVKEGCGGERSDHGFRFVKKGIAQPRLLFIVPKGCGQLVIVNRPGLSDDEVHGVGRARDQWFLPTVRAVPDGHQPHPAAGESRLLFPG